MWTWRFRDEDGLIADLRDTVRGLKKKASGWRRKYQRLLEDADRQVIALKDAADEAARKCRELERENDRLERRVRELEEVVSLRELAVRDLMEIVQRNQRITERDTANAAMLIEAAKRGIDLGKKRGV